MVIEQARRRAGGQIQAGRRVPERRQPLTHLKIVQVVKYDPVARAIGKLGVRLLPAGEVGINLVAVADVRNEQERRPAMVRRNRLGVPLGLALRLCPATAR